MFSSDIDLFLNIESSRTVTIHYFYDTGGDYGTLNFGIVKVLDAVKQTIQLKNKGKYAVGYQ